MKEGETERSMTRSEGRVRGDQSVKAGGAVSG